MELQKKKRGENWSMEEKEILRQLIAESANIIEDKSTKTSINLMKIKEWKKISNKFNEITGKCRTDGELKLAWKRMKLSAKANVSKHRQDVRKTGGGEKPPSPSAEDLAIMAIAPHDFVIEVNDYDSDAVEIPVTTEMFAEPKPGPSNESMFINDDQDKEGQVICNEPIENREGTRMVTTSNNEPIHIHTSSPLKRKKVSQNKNRSETMRQSIVESNIEIKRRQMEIMDVEHKYNVKIAELKIKKLELEISILEDKKNTNKE